MNENDPKIIVQLGRLGDVINILPLAELEAKCTGRPTIVQTAAAFADILEGCSYVEPMIWPGEFTDTVPAIRQARERSANICVGQIYGKGIGIRDCCRSFAAESWYSAGARIPWGSRRPLFDRRDEARERKLVARLPVDGKPIVLCALDGVSAPFPWADALFEQLNQRLGNVFNFVDLSPVRAHRLFDLLAMLERVFCLITIDTSIKHLAAACDVPTIALSTRWPSAWHGSPWRRNYVGCFWYDELRSETGINRLVEKLLLSNDGHARPRLVHCWSDFRAREPDPETARRMQVARESWAMEYQNGDWVTAEFTRADAGRDSMTSIKDTAPVPFHRDVIEYALRKCNNPDDVIVWSNADVCFAPGLTGQILEHCDRRGCAFTHRWDFFRPLDAPFVSEGPVRTGKFYPGSDAFCFTAGWWRRNGHNFPDVVMGREHNDELLRQLIKLTGGLEIEAVIYHEKHASFWESPEHFATNPGNLHNRRLAKRWFAERRLAPNDWIWWSGPTDRRRR